MSAMKLQIIETMVVRTKTQKNKMFPLPMHLPTHGQWWSYPLMHALQSEQWYVVGLPQILHTRHRFSSSSALAYLSFAVITPGFTSPQSKYEIFWSRFKDKVESFMLFEIFFEVQTRYVVPCRNRMKHISVGKKTLKSGPIFSIYFPYKVSKGIILQGFLLISCFPSVVIRSLFGQNE